GFLTIELDNEDRTGVSLDEVAQTRRLGVQLGAVEDVLVGNFDSGRIVLQDHRRGSQRVEQLLEVHHDDDFRLRQLQQAELRFERGGEGAFGGDEEVRQIQHWRAGGISPPWLVLRLARGANAPRSPELIQVVAANTSDDSWIAPLDLVGVLGRESADQSITSA